MFSLSSLSFLKNILTNPYLYVIIGALFLAYQLHHIGYQSGYGDCKTEWDKSIQAAKEANDLLLTQKNQEIKSLNDSLYKLSEEASKINKEAETKSETIIKKVYVYAKENPDNDKSIDVEWLRTYADSLPK